MSLFLNRSGPTPTQMVAERTGARTSRGSVRRNESLTQSTIWACQTLRADLVSTMPVDIFRRVNGTQIEMAKPPVFVKPGRRMRWMEWVYVSQFDLDSYGNAFGIIEARDGAGLPAIIEPVSAAGVSVRCKDGVWTYIIDGKPYREDQVWHEKQYAVAGFPLGLSPLAHAARSIYGYVSAAEFANAWFTNSAVPSGHLKNTARTLNRKQSLKAKTSFKAAVQSGDVWVSGNDWEYKVFNSSASEATFVATMNVSDKAACRFYGVPADMVDVDVSTGTITYQNATVRNLQFLVTKLGPAVARREEAFSSTLLPQPRYAKLNTGALLRMDLKSQVEANKAQIESRTLTVTEARALADRPPLTPEQEAEFARLFPTKAPTPVSQGVPS